MDLTDFEKLTENLTLFTSFLQEKPCSLSVFIKRSFVGQKNPTLADAFMKQPHRLHRDRQ